MKISVTKRLATALVVAALAVSAGACAKGGSSGAGSDNTAAGGGGTLTMWTHNAGNKTELASVEAIVSDYNASQTKYKVEVQAFPQDSYNQSVVAAAAAEEAALHPRHRRPQRARTGPGPATSRRSRAWTRPCRSTCPPPSASYKDQIYSYGYYDVALVMVTRKSILKKYDIRQPTVEQPWTKDEFNAGAEHDQGLGRLRLPAGHRPRASPVSGGRTRTRRSCRASAAT